jgi:hypothetical protein
MKRGMKILLTAFFTTFVTAIAADCSGESGPATVALTGHTTVSGPPSQRMRFLAQGPDGVVYVATDAGEIWSLAPIQ